MAEERAPGSGGASKVLAKLAESVNSPDGENAWTEQRLYYVQGGQRIAMRVIVNGASTVTWLHSDHLGSASMATDVTGARS